MALKFRTISTKTPIMGGDPMISEEDFNDSEDFIISEKDFGDRDRINFIGKFFHFIKKNKKSQPKIKYKNVGRFFKNIHNSIKNLEVDESNIKFYTDAIQSAINNGQTAFAEILMARKETLLAELNLMKMGATKYVDEMDVVNFFLEEKIPNRVLKLTWIKNYTRLIPKEVLAEKKKFDDKFAFDNYVILHFDKTGDSSEMTNAEKQNVKDPILFGVVRNSRKLFYVGDWTDEFCDLTLDKFLEKLEMDKPRELSQEIIEKEVLR